MPLWDAVEAHKMHDRFNRERDQIFQGALQEAKFTDAMSDSSSRGAIYKLAIRIADAAFFRLRAAAEEYDEENRDRILSSYAFNRSHNYKSLIREIEKILFGRQNKIQS